MDWSAHLGGCVHGYFLCRHLDVGPPCHKRAAQAASVASLLVTAIVLLRVLDYTLKIQVLDSLKLGLTAIFLIQMLFMIWAHIEKENEVTIDLIMAAASAYILLGMLWAHAYYFVEKLHPGSFKASDNLGDDIGNFYTTVS